MEDLGEVVDFSRFSVVFMDVPRWAAFLGRSLGLSGALELGLAGEMLMADLGEVCADLGLMCDLGEGLWLTSSE